MNEITYHNIIKNERAADSEIWRAFLHVLEAEAKNEMSVLIANNSPLELVEYQRGRVSYSVYIQEILKGIGES